MNGGDRTKYEPLSWLLIFSSKSSVPWVNRIPGRFKHVGAAAWIEAAKAWVFYDIALHRTMLLTMPEGEGEAHVGRMMGADPDMAILKMPALQTSGIRFPVGFWCVTAVKHLVGLRSGALRPDGLWRDCIASGAEIVHDRAKRTVVSAVAAGDCGTEGC